MRDQWGDPALSELPPAKLVSISSVGGGMAAFPHFRLADGMSKAAVAFMTRQIAAEHVFTPLDVFAICPGATNTGMFQASTLNAMTDAERAAFIDRLPKQRLIEPPEIAELIAFCSPPQPRAARRRAGCLDGAGRAAGVDDGDGALAQFGELQPVRGPAYFPHPSRNPTAKLNTARCPGATGIN